mmetsp:Transcript_47932/g.141540  ORF Transcript_47932/g.141540 Transcript_47932/m.141540 type:complete len:247 (+) Transcript_47932:1320-2060(+)
MATWCCFSAPRNSSEPFCSCRSFSSRSFLCSECSCSICSWYFCTSASCWIVCCSICRSSLARTCCDTSQSLCSCRSFSMRFACRAAICLRNSFSETPSSFRSASSLLLRCSWPCIACWDAVSSVLSFSICLRCPCDSSIISVSLLCSDSVRLEIWPCSSFCFRVRACTSSARSSPICCCARCAVCRVVWSSVDISSIRVRRLCSVVRAVCCALLSWMSFSSMEFCRAWSLVLSSCPASFTISCWSS